jgi:hypothetical protein
MTLPLPKSHQMLRRGRPDKVSSLDPLTHFRRAPVTIVCPRLPLLASDFEPLIVKVRGRSRSFRKWIRRCRLAARKT